MLTMFSLSSVPQDIMAVDNDCRYLPTLWSLVDYKAKFRLIKDCESAYGEVIDVEAKNDGNLHVRLKLNAGQTNLLVNGSKKDYIEFEILYVHHEIREEIKKSYYSFMNEIYIPSIGDKVKVTGILVFNLKTKQNELFPVSNITKIEN